LVQQQPSDQKHHRPLVAMGSQSEAHHEKNIVDVPVDSWSSRGIVHSPNLNNVGMPSAQQVKVDNCHLRNIWPEHWGITRQQIKGLLVDLRKDPAWCSSNSVYTLVHDFLVPWTVGTGVGYAVNKNIDEPKEVNVMVSHAWAENAEEFLETVIRSTHDSDVMFICALSLYQAEDCIGPTVSEQLGRSLKSCPFKRVLEHISRQGHTSGCRWSRGKVLKFLAPFFAIAAVACFYLPMLTSGCVPSFTHCAFKEEYDPIAWDRRILKILAMPYNEPVRKWVWQPVGPWFAVFPCLAIFFSVCSLTGLWLARGPGVYRGRMIVVPNREADIYSRLWCVYEIFLANTLGLPVEIARTLARAGTVRSEFATCSSEEDTQAILTEIDAAGESFKNIDRAVHQTTRWTRIHSCCMMLYYGVPMALWSAAERALCSQSTHLASMSIYAINSLLASVICVTTTYFVFRNYQGSPSLLAVLVLVALQFVVGVIIIVVFAGDFMGCRICMDSAAILACTLVGTGARRLCVMFSWSGVVAVAVAVQIIWLVFLVARDVTTIGLVQWYPTIVYRTTYMLQSWWFMVFVVWTAAAFWGTRVQHRCGHSQQ